VCADSRRELIEAAMATGQGLRTLAARFAISKSSLHRHQTQHLGLALTVLEAPPDPNVAGATLAAAPAVSKVEVWGRLLEGQLKRNEARTERLYSKAEIILERALRRKDNRTAIAAIRTAVGAIGEIRSAIELQAKLAGQLVAAGGTVINNNVLIAGEAGNAVLEKLSALITRARGETPALLADAGDEPGAETIDADSEPVEATS
jgi:hypothetical protein